ncbi:MAG TPA: alpha/beta hydrolase, partial [Roseiflexaceae bacterium]|nr:alpha/beta hydrolase [Roseiflexaceae bacterium]
MQLHKRFGDKRCGFGYSGHQRGSFGYSANSSNSFFGRDETDQRYAALFPDYGKGAADRFLHGRSGSDRYFLPFAEPLASEYQLVLYDQRGTGSSDGKIDLKAISIDQFVEDLKSLRAALGFEKMSLLAHSSGANIALFYAFKYQAHLDKLILVNPVPVTKMFAAEQLQTLKQRIDKLKPEAQQMLNTTCSRTGAISAEERAECLNIDATLRFFEPAKAQTMDSTPEQNTEKNAATIQSLLTTSLNRRQQEIEPGLATISAPTLIV